MATRGTGIGLALVKNIVERHHGTINVVSSEGYGSVFVVQLCKDSTQFAADEIESVEASIDEPLVAEEAVATEGMAKVLVVEDNDELLAARHLLAFVSCRRCTQRQGGTRHDAC